MISKILVAIAAASMTNAVSAQECKPLEPRAQRARPATRLSRPDSRLRERSNVGFNVVVLAKGLEQPGRSSRCQAASSSSPRSPVACASCPRRARWARRLPGCRKWTRAGRAEAARRGAEPGLRVRPHHLLQLCRAARRRQWATVARGVLSGNTLQTCGSSGVPCRPTTAPCTTVRASRWARTECSTSALASAPTCRCASMRSSPTAGWARSCASRPTARAPRSGRWVTATCRRWPSTPRDVSGSVEHGARGGDELNLIERGKNYGWPLVAYGEEYSGEPFPGAVTAMPGYEQPVYYWDPVIAPSGAQFYSEEAFPEWPRRPLHRRRRHEARPPAPRERQGRGRGASARRARPARARRA